MDEKLKNVFDAHATEGFIKTCETPSKKLNSEQKAMLNRRGNQYFNEGNVDEAKKIFLATGYSDGLSRIADRISKKGEEMEALKLYYLAHNKRKVEPLAEKLALIISNLIKESD